jgi:hypothetical protein
VRQNGHVVEQFAEVMKGAFDLHAAIDEVQDAAVEMVLKSECAGVSKVTHLLRAEGDNLSSSNLSHWDDAMRCSLGRSLNGELEDHAWAQAASGYDQGGLNGKTAVDLALPAFLASRVAARPAAQLLFQSLEDAGFASVSLLEEAFDARTQAAEERLASMLPTDLAARLHSTMREGSCKAARRWNAITGDVTVSDELEEIEGDPFLAAAMTMDRSEPGADRSGHYAGPLQRALSAISDEANRRERASTLQREGKHADLRRLAELRDGEDQERSWLWAIRRGVEPTMPPADYALAVRTMLGASVLIQPMVCGGCGKAVLDTQGRHALCCLGAATTIGHNRVRDVVAMGLACADPGTVIEPAGLVPSRPDLRPADVLSRAGLEQGLIAGDIGIASPEAGGAGQDCVEAMRRRKLAFYGDDVCGELQAQHITYTPLVVSCYGRRSRVLTELLRSAALRAARIRDGASGSALQRRWQRAIATEIWRRTAALVRRCLPTAVLDAGDEPRDAEARGGYCDRD